jgi:hypothetical protein
MNYHRRIIMSSSNQETNRSNKEKHFSVDNSDRQDSKEEKQQESGETTTTIDITKVGDTSRDILDITDTPDVATWNKGTQIKGNAAEIIKRSQERGERIEAIAQKKITPTNTNTIGIREKGSEDLIIDPADKEVVAKIVKSGKTLTDKPVEDPFSGSDNNSQDNQKKSKKAK